MAELYTRLVLRNDSAENWEANKTKSLLKGELGVEFDENGKAKVKIGNGVEGATWETLPYFGGEEAKVYQASSVEELPTEDVAIGDTGIVKAPIYENAEDETKNKYSYTGYVYTENGWSAMDGNYSAANVFIEKDLTLAGSFSSVGNYAKGKKISGGTSLETLLSGMLQQELYPNANDKPNASITVSGGSGEVGSSYTLPTATLKITDVGSYGYGPATGIKFEIGDVKLAQGADPETATNYKTNDAVMVKDSTITLQATDTATLYTDSAKTYTFSGTGSYTQGAIPVTNLGNPHESARIPAGDVTITDATATFSGYRYTFGGSTTAETINSTAIRALTKKHKSSDAVPTTSGGTGIVFSAKKDDTKLIFAYPSSWTTKTPKFEIFTMAWGATEGFVKSTVNVADSRGGENGLKEYTVYTYTPATPFAADNTDYCVYFA